MKIGLITWFDSVNYGTCLQAYALSHVLSERGHEVWLPSTIRCKTIFSGRDCFRRVIRRVSNRVKQFQKKESAENLSLSAQYEIRRKKKADFINKHMHVFEIKSKADFDKLNTFCDAFVTGSDQIWNPYHLSPVALLSFVADDKKKVAYSSSVGVATIPHDLHKIYIKYLKRFNNIGVREKDAAEYLSRMIGRNVETVLDPTFLLTKEKIEQLEVHSEGEKLVDGNLNYILCYYVGDKQGWVEQVKKLAELVKLPVYIVMSESGVVPAIGKPIASAGIYDFLWLIDHAAYVCTDSFHCIALSLNMHKNFLAFKRFEDADVHSQNSRVYSILNSFSLGSRMVVDEESMRKVLNENIDYSRVEEELERKRVESRKFLFDSLSCG